MVENINAIGLFCFSRKLSPESDAAPEDRNVRQGTSASSTERSKCLESIILEVTHKNVSSMVEKQYKCRVGLRTISR